MAVSMHSRHGPTEPRASPNILQSSPSAVQNCLEPWQLPHDTTPTVRPAIKMTNLPRDVVVLRPHDDNEVRRRRQPPAHGRGRHQDLSRHSGHSRGSRRLSICMEARAPAPFASSLLEQKQCPCFQTRWQSICPPAPPPMSRVAAQPRHPPAPAAQRSIAKHSSHVNSHL